MNNALVKVDYVFVNQTLKDNFYFFETMERRSINSKGAERGKLPCLTITSYINKDMIINHYQCDVCGLFCLEEYLPNRLINKIKCCASCYMQIIPQLKDMDIMLLDNLEIMPMHTQSVPLKQESLKKFKEVN